MKSRLDLLALLVKNLEHLVFLKSEQPLKAMKGALNFKAAT